MLTGAARVAGAGGVLFGGGFVAFAAVVGDVESGAFKQESSPGAEEAFDGAFAPLLHLAVGFGAGFERIIFHGLKELEGFVAF